MGLYRYYPPADGRMGMILALAGISDTAILEFGPMGTANYGGMMLGSYGLNRDSLHFSTHMTDTQIALGDFSCLEEAIDAILENHSPRAIFVVPSALSDITGVDLNLFCGKHSTDRCKIILLPSPGIGKEDAYGIEKALCSLLPFAQAGDRPSKPCYSILGTMADDYTGPSDTVELVRLMRDFFRAEPLCIMPWGADPESLAKLGRGHVNLVIRSEALPLAENLRQEYGIPYVYGRPCGCGQTVVWLEQIRQQTGWEPDLHALEWEKNNSLEIQRRLVQYVNRTYHGKGFPLLFSSRYDTARAVGRFLKEDLGLSAQILYGTWARDDLPKTEEALWKDYIDRNPDCLVLGDAGMCAYRQTGGEIVAHPGGCCLDLSGTRPFVGFRGGSVVAELLWNLLHRKYP